MKKLSLACLAAWLAVPGMASAIDGTIRIEGSIIARTCVVTNGAAPSADVRVRLPTVAVGELTASGDFAGRTPFIIRVADCDADVAQTYFEPGPNVDISTNNLSLTDGPDAAQNVQLQLLNADFSQILLGNPLPFQNTQVVAVSSGEAELRYYAQYVSTGNVGAGLASSNVQFTVVYP